MKYESICELTKAGDDFTAANIGIAASVAGRCNLRL